jgi:hypothetical protein
LFPLPTLSPPTPLVGTKTAFSFAVHTSVQHVTLDNKSDFSSVTEFAKPKPIPTLVTQLLVGCRRKVVLYSWRDGEAQDVKVNGLYDPPRLISCPRALGSAITSLTACNIIFEPQHSVFRLSTTRLCHFLYPYDVCNGNLDSPSCHRIHHCHGGADWAHWIYDIGPRCKSIEAGCGYCQRNRDPYYQRQ